MAESLWEGGAWQQQFVRRHRHKLPGGWRFRRCDSNNGEGSTGKEGDIFGADSRERRQRSAACQSPKRATTQSSACAANGRECCRKPASSACIGNSAKRRTASVPISASGRGGKRVLVAGHQLSVVGSGARPARLEEFAGWCAHISRRSRVFPAAGPGGKWRNSEATSEYRQGWSGERGKGAEWSRGTAGALG